MEVKMGTVITNTFYSKALGIDWNYSVYLPKEPIQEDAELWFLFHGAYGHQLNFLERIDMKRHLDTLETKDIFVFVDGFNSFYIDGPGIAMETALMKEMIPYFEEQYGIEKSNLAGISMGGYGALRLSLKHPDRFNKVAAISPAIWYEMGEGVPTYDWHVFRDRKGAFKHRLWQREHPSSYLALNGKNQTRYFLMTGKKDGAVPYLDVDKFYKEMKHLKFDVHYDLDEDGDHSWPFWDRAMLKMLSYFED